MSHGTFEAPHSLVVRLPNMADRLLYPDDIVAKKANLSLLAAVERTHGDVDTHIPRPSQNELDPIKPDASISRAAFRQFLKDGIPPKDTVLVRWVTESSAELLPVSKLKLVDRSLLIGDIVKRSVHDAMSGCILNTNTSCDLQPICDISYRGSHKLKGLLPPDEWDPTVDQFYVMPNDRPEVLRNVPASELELPEPLAVEDLVIYKDWIGRVVEITNNIHVKLSDNCVVEIADSLGESPQGAEGQFTIGDIVKAKKADLRNGKWIYGRYNANTPPVGTVVSLRPVLAEVAWIEKRIGSPDTHEPHRVLESPELESTRFQVYDRTKRPSGPAVGAPTTSNSEIDVSLNLRVRFRDLTGARLKYNTPSNANRLPLLDRRTHLGYDLNVFDVTKFHTTVSVQWQDLSITTENSIDLVPDGNIDDEHAAWPGEIAHTLALEPVPGMVGVKRPKKAGVVQCVNPAERMAILKWSPSSFVHYAQDESADTEQRILAYSIKDESCFEEEISLYDMEANAALNVRRGDLVLIANPDCNHSTSSQHGASWIGEIVDTPLDGTFVVRLGAASEVRDVVLLREETVTAVRSDGTGHMDEWNEDGVDEEEYSDSEDSGEMEEWDSDDDSIDDEVDVRYEDENGMELDEGDVENEEWESADEENEDEDAEMQDAVDHQTPPTSHSNSPRDQSEASTSLPGAEHPSVDPESAHDSPAAYLVLEDEVPQDHRYRNEPSTATSAHVKRTQKEHKILRNPSTLPGGVYIRTWESRLDLLRVLLVGPSETPYAHAPFVIDVYLPSPFPNEPPQAFFHSWPAHSNIGAIGRVNPNLYEDGKICLSLLGTWEGNKGEGWNASRSTLLQVIVSLLGLVLVREPYYNEAGYENLIGSEASKRPSALYSERTFIRAKSCLITALDSHEAAVGIDGLQDVLGWLYKDLRGPKLLDVTIREVEEVLSRSDGTQEPDGLTAMSKGAAISLRRVLDHLLKLKTRYYPLGAPNMHVAGAPGI